MKILAAKSFIFISFKFACLNKYWHRICGGGGGGGGGSILVQGFFGGLIFANFIINTPVL